MDQRKKHYFLRNLLTNRTIFLSGIVMMISYVLLLLIFFRIIDLNTVVISPNLILTILTLAALVIFTGTLTYVYLQGSTKRIKEKNENLGEGDKSQLSYDLSEIQHLLDQNRFEFRSSFESLKEEIEATSKRNFELLQKNASYGGLEDKIIENLNEDFFMSLNAKISSEISKSRRNDSQSAIYILKETSERLMLEIKSLGRKSDVNLILGSLLTLTALLILGLSIFPATKNVLSVPEILHHFIPKISFVLFIEVFAFFFLRLYKINLNDIKYYQNEISNIEMKLSGSILSINFGTETDISLAISNLMNTERNFILEKGQTTIDFEKYKHDENAMLKFFKESGKFYNKTTK